MNFLSGFAYPLTAVVLFACLACVLTDEDEAEKAAAIGVDEDEKIPVSEHEFPKENVPTKPDYRGPGHWATPAPDSNIQLGFVPIKLYTQVRRSVTVKHLPRSDALASATTAEEIANAPRLREVISTKKISEVYTEEGYEDSAYDHGGFAKEAENHEGYNHNEGARQKPKSRRQKTAQHDDSEIQGTNTQEKQVTATGEQFNKKDSRPQTIFRRHKVMRNEKRTVFVENQGEDGVPLKLMASYSHTVQHPSSTKTDRSKIPSYVTHSVNTGSSDVLKISRKPKQLLSEVALPSARLDKRISYRNVQPLNLLGQHSYTVPFFIVPSEVTTNERTMNNYDQLKENVYGVAIQKFNSETAQQNLQVQETRDGKQGNEESVMVSKILSSGQESETKSEVTLPSVRLEKTISHRNVQPSNLLGQHSYTVPFFIIPSEVKTNEQSMNNYDQLRENLYGVAIHKFNSAQQNLQVQEIRDGKQGNEESVTASTILSSGQDSGTQSPSLKLVESDQDTAINNSHDSTRSDNILRVITMPWDSIYQRKHPTIPLEDVQRLQTTKLPLQDISSGNSKESKLQSTDQIRYISIPVEVKTLQVVGNSEQGSSEDKKRISTNFKTNENSKESSVGKSVHFEDELGNMHPIISIYIPPNKTKNENIYNSKYKDSTKFRNTDRFNNAVNVTKLTEVYTNENTPKVPSQHGNVHTIPYKENSNSGPQFLNPESQINPLPLWAKFVEALTLAQYSNKSKHVNGLHDGKGIVVPTQPTAKYSTVYSTEPIISTQPTDKYSRVYYAAEEKLLIPDNIHSKNVKDHDFIIIQPISQSNVELSSSEKIAVETKKAQASSEGHNESPSVSLIQRHPMKLVLDLTTITENNETEANSTSPNLKLAKDDQLYQESVTNSEINTEPGRKITARRIDYGYGTPKYLSGDEEEKRLEEEEKLLEEEKDKDLVENVNEWKEALENAEKNISPAPQINTKKYPFYNTLPKSVLSLYSPLRYATNPKDIPLKTEGGMEFYESRESIYCPEITGPGEVVPKRTAPGEWNKKPKARLPRLKGLGDKIDCMRTKFFGSEPLDNPFFKETTVGLPEQAASGDTESAIDAHALGFYADIMEHIRDIGHLKNIPQYSLSKPKKINYQDKLEHYANYVSEPDTAGNVKRPETFIRITGQDAIKPGSSLKNEKYSTSPAGPIAFHNAHTISAENLYGTAGLKDHEIPSYPDKTINFTKDGAQQYLGTTDQEVNNLHHVFNPTFATHQQIQSHSSTLANKILLQEEIIGMLPPPPPPLHTPTYFVIKKINQPPKIIPASIITVLGNSPLTKIQKNKPLDHYDYRSIKGMKPPPIQYHIPTNIGNNLHKEELASTVIDKESDSTKGIPERTNQPPYNMANTDKDVPNTDILVAEESSKQEALTVSNVSHLSYPEIIKTINKEHHRERRRAVRYNERSDDISENDKDINAQDNPNINIRRMSTRNKTKNGKSKRKNNVVEGEPVKLKNYSTNGQRRKDNEDEIYYLPYEEERDNTRKRNNFRKVRPPKESSELTFGESPVFTEYAATVDYNINHDVEQPKSNTNSYPVMKTVKTRLIKTKQVPKTQEGITIADSRRGEPRYLENEERKKDGYNRVPSHKRRNTNTREKLTNKSAGSSRTNDGTSKSSNKKPIKPDEYEHRGYKNTKSNCENLNEGDSCDKNDDKQTQISLDYEYPNEEADGIYAEDIIQDQYLTKPFSKDFESNEPIKKVNSTSQEKSNSDDPITKFRSKYSGSIMSADQINKILGGFMSRHNPSYSSKYKADDTTILPETTTSTTTATTITPSYTTEQIPETESKVNEDISPLTTSIPSKDPKFQKVRVVPILNRRVIPELVTSTIKPPDYDKHKRKPSISKSPRLTREKIESSSQQLETTRGKSPRIKQHSNGNKRGRNEETGSRIQDTKADLTITSSSTAQRRKQNSSRGRGSTADRSVKKTKTWAAEEDRKDTVNRKEIPIENKNYEDTKSQRVNTDRNLPRNRQRNRKGRENIGKDISNTSNSAKEKKQHVNENSSTNAPENTTAAAPRRLQAIEHRRVTKEEIFTTTYIPEDDLASEMERQSDIEADELEAADNSRDRYDRDINEEEESTEDVYEPFESNYDSQKFSHPRNRSTHDANLYGDEDWNKRRGYYIVHKADDAPKNHLRQSSNFKQGKRIEKLKNNYSEDKKYRGENNDSLPSEEIKNLEENVSNTDLNNKSVDSPMPRKVTTGEGVKGFYITKPLDKTKRLQSTKEENGYKENKDNDKVLTYVVNEDTGIGRWIQHSSDETAATRQNDRIEVNKDEDDDQIKWTSAQQSSKRSNSFTRQNKPSLRNRKFQSKESDDQKQKAGEEVEKGTSNTKSFNSFKNLRSKSPRRNITEDETEEKVMSYNPSDVIKNGPIRKLDSTKTDSKSRPQKPSRQLKKYDDREFDEERSDYDSYFKRGKDKQMRTDSKHNKRGKDENENPQVSESRDEKGSIVYEPYRFLNTKKGSNRRNKSKRFGDYRNQFELVDENLKPSDSGFVYHDDHEESETQNVNFEPNKETEIKDDTSADDEVRNDKDKYEEAIARLYSKLLGEIPPAQRNRFKDGEEMALKTDEIEDHEDVENANDNVQRFIKHPGERKYYYVEEGDEAKEDDIVQNIKRKPVLQNRMMSRSGSKKIFRDT